MTIAEGYTPDPPTPNPTDNRGKSRYEHEQEFARKFLAAAYTDKAVIDQRELVDAGHPARMVYTPNGTYLVTVSWLGPQTLQG